MKTLLSSLIVVLISTQIYAAPKVRFDGPYNIGLEGVIEAGEIETSETEPAYIEQEIRDQLSFLVGALNGWTGVFDMDRAAIKVGVKNETTGRFAYTAKVFISWPKSMQIPQILNFPIPARGDSRGIREYFSRYSKDCSENPNDSELDETSFFYYYRPQNSRCAASHGGAKPEGVFFPSIKVGLSELNSKGKFPEYGKVWEDGELTATLLVGTYKAGATENHDVGISEYNQLYRAFWRQFGRPTEISVPIGASTTPGMQYPDIEMTWKLSNGKKFNLVLLLIDKNQLQMPSMKFRERLQNRIEASDLVSYNGHSGLGANIRALVHLGKYKKNKYQIFYFNGCDTFSYVDNSLAQMHEAVNPGFGKHKFVDYIMNSMPSPFSGFEMSNFALIRGLIGSQQTYVQILSQFDSYQKVVVMGEEDNNWPKPF